MEGPPNGGMGAVTIEQMLEMYDKQIKAMEDEYQRQSENPFLPEVARSTLPDLKNSIEALKTMRDAMAGRKH